MTPKELSYSDKTTLHKELRAKHGNAKKCEICDSKNAKRYEWALKKKRDYSLDIKDYLQLCPSCHRKYDKCFGKIGEIMKGRPAINRRKVKNSNNEVFDCIRIASEKTGILRTAIANCLSRKSKKAGGLRWEYV